MLFFVIQLSTYKISILHGKAFLTIISEYGSPIACSFHSFVDLSSFWFYHITAIKDFTSLHHKPSFCKYFYMFVSAFAPFSSFVPGDLYDNIVEKHCLRSSFSVIQFCHIPGEANTVSTCIIICSWAIQPKHSQVKCRASHSPTMTGMTYSLSRNLWIPF